MSFLLIILVGVTCPGCTVLGAAVGSAFNTPTIEHDPASIGPDIVGDVVEIMDRSGETHQGKVVEVLDGAVVIVDARDLFAHSTAETLSIAHIESLRVGDDNSGSDTGLMLGFIADVLVITYVVAGLGAIGEASQ